LFFIIGAKRNRLNSSAHCYNVIHRS
jgi:hypothetical protein